MTLPKPRATHPNALEPSVPEKRSNALVGWGRLPPPKLLRQEPEQDEAAPTREELRREELRELLTAPEMDPGTFERRYRQLTNYRGRT